MTKELYPAPSRINIICMVTSIKNGRKFVSTEIGTNSMFNTARDYKEKILNAKLNAIYKHMNHGGGSDAIVEVLDYDIKYFTKLVTIKKEKIVTVNTKGIRQEKTYAYGVSKTTGKRVYKARIVKKADIKEF